MRQALEEGPKTSNHGLASPATAPYVAPLPFPGSAPVAQLDRAPDYESGGQRFESFRARHFLFRDINRLAGRRLRAIVLPIAGCR